MRKSCFTLLLAAVTTLSAMAIPARQGLRTLHQPDGSTITVTLVGDENFHTFLTEDGLPVMRNAEGVLVYRTAEGASPIVAHDLDRRTPDELSFISRQGSALSLRALLAKPGMLRAPRNAAPQKASQVPQKGSPRIPILLVAFKDYPFRDGAGALQTFTNFFSTGAKSAHQYFVDQSNGKYTPQFDIYGPYTLTKNRAAYGGNDYKGNDKGIGTMVGEGCLGLDSQIDFSLYDNNGDGACDVVVVLYAGDGEASSDDDDAEDAVWPCQWDLRSSDYGKNLKLDGVTVSKFAVFNELYGRDLSKIDGIGTFCHEYSHCLNLPDFYETTYTNGYFGMGPWSLMDYGSYNDNGYTPIGYSAYEKNFMGWIDLPEAVANTHYTLPVFNVSAANDQAVKITNDRASNEYYILENRAKQGWDRYIEAEGLMITSVTYSSSAWSNNTVNNYALQRMTIIPADNELKMDKKTSGGETYYTINTASLKGDLWPYKNATELTDTSVPAAKLNTGSLMGKPITEITKNSDGTVSLWFCKVPRQPLDVPTLADPEGVTPSKFHASWNHPDPDKATFTLEVTTHKEETLEKIIKTDFNVKANSYEGWTLSKDGYNQYDAQNKMFRLGSTSKGGAIELTDTFVADDSEFVTVVVDCEKWKTDSNCNLTITTICDGEETYNEKIDVDARATHYVPLLAVAGSDTKVKIETVRSGSKNNRVIIYDVEVWNGYAGDGVVPSEAPRRVVSEVGDMTSRTISGITDTWFEVEGLTEGGSFDYRVKAVPVNADTHEESDWSPTKTVVLASPTAVALTPAAESIARYYNLQGVCVATGDGEALRYLPAGCYVRVRGGVSDKIVIR